MIVADLPAVLAVAAIVHPSYPEDEAVFTERLRLAPEGCHVLEGEGALLGYLVSHPWPFGAVPPLNSLLGAIPGGAANWYIHDLALLPEGRGGGAASRILSEIVRHAASRGCTGMTLVAVNDSAGFWRRQGFRQLHVSALADKLASYDDAACYMGRDVNG